MSTRDNLLDELPINNARQITASTLQDVVNSAVMPEDLIAGSNITIDKSALPAITISVSGGGNGGGSMPTLATVATTGNYTDLENIPDFATVAMTGNYTDLTNTPTIPDLSTLATVATTGSYSDLSNTPELATVANTGNYSDINGTPTLATVATSGNYADLNNAPWGQDSNGVLSPSDSNFVYLGNPQNPEGYPLNVGVSGGGAISTEGQIIASAGGYTAALLDNAGGSVFSDDFHSVRLCSENNAIEIDVNGKPVVLIGVYPDDGIIFPNLPTSDPATQGALWVDNLNYLRVSAG